MTNESQRQLDKIEADLRLEGRNPPFDKVRAALHRAFEVGRDEMHEHALAACRRNLYVHTPMDSYAEEAEGVRRAIVEIMHADDFPEAEPEGQEYPDLY